MIVNYYNWQCYQLNVTFMLSWFKLKWVCLIEIINTTSWQWSTMHMSKHVILKIVGKINIWKKFRSLKNWHKEIQIIIKHKRATKEKRRATIDRIWYG